MEIAKSLPHRSVQSVYRHGIRQLHPFKRGAWSDAECEQLVELVSRLGKKWASIQTKLHRSADSCRDKYREMSEVYTRGRWKESETEQLSRLIREHVLQQAAAQNIDTTAQMGDHPGNNNIKAIAKLVHDHNISIPWSIISKRMVKRSRLSCFKKWQKMTGLSSTNTTDHDYLMKKDHLDTSSSPASKRLKTSNGTAVVTTTNATAAVLPFVSSAETAGAAAAAVLAQTNSTYDGNDHDVDAAQQHAADEDDDDDVYHDAKMADATVQAVDLPDNLVV